MKSDAGRMAEEFLDDMKFDAELEGFDIKIRSVAKITLWSSTIKTH